MSVKLYSYQEILNAIPGLSGDISTEEPANINPPFEIDLERIRSALDFIDPDSEYHEWLNLGMALKSTNHPEAFEIWDVWSAKGVKYESGQTRSKWGSFNGQGIEIGTLFYLAKKSGWDDNPKVSDAVEQLLYNVVYLGEPDRFYDIKENAIYKSSGFANMCRHLDFGKKNAPSWLTSHPEAKKAANLVYYPGKPAGHVNFLGKNCYNIYKPATAKLISNVLDSDIQAYLKLTEYLIPNKLEREHMLDLLAYSIQRPDTKINQAILFGGLPRIGKDTLLQPFIYAAGSHNVSQPDASELKDKYTGYLARSKIVIFQEAQNFEKSEIENRLKPMIASPPAELRVNEKYLVSFDIPNVVFCIFMSNHKNSLKISPNDGRYFAVWSPATPKKPCYYANLYNWYQDDSGYDLVYSWFMQRNLTAFNPKAPAPDTAYKNEVIGMGSTDLAYRFNELINQGKLYPLMKFDDIACKLDYLGNNNISNKVIRNMLIEAGAIRKEIRSADKSRTQATIWIVDKIEDYKQMSGKELYMAWEELQPAGLKKSGQKPTH